MKSRKDVDLQISDIANTFVKDRQKGWHRLRVLYGLYQEKNRRQLENYQSCNKQEANVILKRLDNLSRGLFNRRQK